MAERICRTFGHWRRFAMANRDAVIASHPKGSACFSMGGRAWLSRAGSRSMRSEPRDHTKQRTRSAATGYRFTARMRNRFPAMLSIRTHWIRMVLMVLSSVASPEFLVRIAKGQMQILRLTTPKLQPADEDLSAGAPELKSVWGPIPTPATKTCRRGPRFAPYEQEIRSNKFSKLAAAPPR